MYCTSCGAARRDPDARFCVACGAAYRVDPAGYGGVAPTVVIPTPQAAPAWTPVEPPRPPVGRSARGPAVAAVAAAAVLVLGASAVYALTRTGAARPSSAVHAAAATPSPSTSPTPSAAASTSPSPPPASFASLYATVSDGVVRIETTACDGGGVGSGFLLAPDLIATVAHVVSGAQNIVIRAGSVVTTGTVVGIDPSQEVALVRSTNPLPGHVFRLADQQPQVGDDVAAIGYPLAGAESLTKGAVSGLSRQENVEGTQLNDLMQTDTPINPGNSGGPLLTVDGNVVGLVEAKASDAENIGFAVPSTDAAVQLNAWLAQPVPVTAAHCAAPTGPSGISADVTDDSGSADGPAIARLFSTYATGINTGDYQASYAELSRSAQARTSLSSFIRGETSSYVFNVHIAGVSRVLVGRDRAEVSFTSVQDPAAGVSGQSCSRWQITYTLVAGGDAGWLIDGARAHPGSPAAC